MANAYFQPPIIGFSTSNLQTGVIQDATTDLVGWAIPPEEDATVLSVLVFLTVRTGSPGTFRIGFQGCDATTGLNDGVWQSYTDINASSLTGIGQFFNFTLDTPQTVQRGKIICIVIQPISGTWNASNSLSVAIGRQNAYPWQALPYVFTNTTGTTAKVTTSLYLFYGYRSATKTYGNPIRSGTTAAFNSTTTPDEYGMRFTLPATWGKRYTLLGINANHRFSGGGNTTINLNLYDSSSNLLAQNSFDSDQVFIPNPGTNNEGTYQFMFDESTLPELSYGTEYIIAIEATNSVNQQGVFLTALQASDYSAITDATLQYVTRKDTGAWTTNALLAMSWQLMIRETSGGGIGYPGMTGGMRG